MRNMLDLCKESRTLDYSKSLHGDNCRNIMNELEEKTHTNKSSMILYYRSIIEPIMSCVYSSFTNDYHRLIIMRWRLSNHKLRIETGRYERPFIPRKEILCLECGILEDEQRIIFDCPLYDNIRLPFRNYLSSYNTVKKVLNPVLDSIKTTATLLYKLEDLKKSMEE